MKQFFLLFTLLVAGPLLQKSVANPNSSSDQMVLEAVLEIKQKEKELDINLEVHDEKIENYRVQLHNTQLPDEVTFQLTDDRLLKCAEKTKNVVDSYNFIVESINSVVTSRLDLIDKLNLIFEDLRRKEMAVPDSYQKLLAHNQKRLEIETNMIDDVKTDIADVLDISAFLDIHERYLEVLEATVGLDEESEEVLDENLKKVKDEHSVLVRTVNGVRH